MTVAIPSFQRRTALRRLLNGLRAQIAATPQLARNLDVVVVLDGSTDGSVELLQSLPFPVPLRALWQPNRGLAAARNAALAVAGGEIVWFLDDDMVPADGLLGRHRSSHDPGSQHVLMGPCLFPADHPVVFFNREWADFVYGELARTGRVTEASYFSAANTSAPLRLLRYVGGFDERFTGWGGEDHELGLRLVAAGVDIRYDQQAVAWHHQRRGIREMCGTKVGEGRSLVRIAMIHPEEVGNVLPIERPPRVYRWLRKLPGPSPRVLRLLGQGAAWLAAGEARLFSGRRRRFFLIAVAVNKLAGIAEADPDGGYVARVLDAAPPHSSAG